MNEIGSKGLGVALRRGLGLFCLLLVSTAFLGCPADDVAGAGDGEEDGKPQCEDDLLPLGEACCLECGCNACETGICFGTANGDYLLDGVHGYLTADFPICTIECASDADCGEVSMLGDGRQAVERRFCDSFPEGNYCAVDLEAPSGDNCGEPCPEGCCSPSGLTCCQPPFCDGDCIGSPCC